MGGMGGAGGVVDEEGLVRCERRLLADPVDRSVGQILGEVITLLRCLVGLDGRGVQEQRRLVLIRSPPMNP